MAYVKNHNPGKITMDLPTANYIYELPLLSVGDIHGNVNVSLVFNREMAENDLNPYFIQPGYKLNLQKMIIFSGESPVCVQDAMGNRVNVNAESWPYTFEDESQRILRQSGITARPYVIEYPDRSLEYYNSSGMIVLVVDKYGEEVLEFTYTSGQLRTITYRDNKYIRLTYNTTTKTLKTLAYDNNNFVTSFAYPTDTITVTHYSGVTYNVNHGDYTNFVASTTITENSSTVTYKTELSEAESTITISDYVGGNQIDTTSYTFPSAFTNETVKNGDKYMEVIIVDKNDVETRAQYYDGKLLYSYELTDGDANISNDQYLGTVQIYNTVDDLKSSQAVGAKTINNGCEFSEDPPAVERWKCDVNRWFGGDIKGYYLLSGWMKAKSSATAFGHTKLYISNDSTASGLEFYPCILVDDKWKFFAYKFYMDASFIAVGTVFKEKVDIKGLRIEPQYIQIQSASDKSRTMVSEEVLIHTDGGDETIIPIRGSAFTCGNETVVCNAGLVESYDSDYVSFNDLLRYKINQKQNLNTTEFYYNNGKKVVVSSTAASATVTYNGVPYDLSECNLGRRSYTQGGMILTKIECTANGATSKTLLYTDEESSGVEISAQTVNRFFDVISKTTYEYSTGTKRSFVTSYTRNKDLITGEAVSNLYSRTYSYSTDTSGNPTITVTDELSNKTVYTLDSVWGVVKSIKLPNDSIVSDTYDDDMCAMTKRAFDSTSSKYNTLAYSHGNISTLQTGELNYDFTYSAGKLKTVGKNSSSSEEYTYAENANSKSKRTQVNSFYPTQASKLHSTVAYFDVYERLTAIDGVLTNTYDLWPSYDSTTGELVPSVDNGSSLLATTTDEMRGEVIKYDYNKLGLLETRKVVDESDNSNINTESFAYDDYGRPTTDTFDYNPVGNKKVITSIGYFADDRNPTRDQKVNVFTYAIETTNNNTKTTKTTKTTNTFDKYGRVTKKVYSVDGKAYTKTLTYNYTSVSKETDTAGITNTYTYDKMGRISKVVSGGNTTTYHYDQYGQIVREDNQALDATFVYVYNNIANLTSVKKYAYTAAASSLSGTPTTTTFGYSIDKLTTFGGKTIAYNAMGCPTSYEGMNASWTRGKLSRLGSGTLESGTKSYTYTYNAFGQRVSRSYSYFQGTSAITPVQVGEVTGYTKQYSYDHSGRLIAEKIAKTLYNAGTSTEQAVYLYDESGMIGMEYTPANGSAQLYYFQRNLLGDVVALYDTSGNMVAKYLYDAWGNCTISSETTNYAVAHANPIRYRGYYYDEDTGLYYCNARYYSPKWRRFISPDDTAYLDPASVNGLNLYCYCNNDPVNLIDPSGNDPKWLDCLLIAGFAAATIALTIASCSAAAAAIAPYAFIYFGVAANTTLALTTAAVAATSVGIAAFAIADMQSVITDGQNNYLSFLGESYNTVKGTFYFASSFIVYASQFAVPGWGKQTYGKDDAPQYGDKYGAYHKNNDSLTIYNGRGQSVARYDFGHEHYGMQPHVHYFKWWIHDDIWRWDGKKGTIRPYY